MNKYYYELHVNIPNDIRDIVESFLLDYFNNGVEETKEGFILRDEKPFENLKEKLINYINDLEVIFNKKIEYTLEEYKKENQDWIDNYKNSIMPVEVGDFYIHPTWHKSKENKINIIINPALAFGSGHHETTRSCVKAISKYVKENNSFLDVGCGSGILSIVAAKLGAKVDLCDTDEMAVRSAEENFILNDVKYENIWQGSANKANKKYDVVVANIIADILILIYSDLKKVSGNILILSGIIDKYKEKVLKKYKDFDILDELYDGEWVTLVLKVKKDGR